MEPDKKVARCPVGQERLGWINEGDTCSFVCHDCGYRYTWDTHGKLRKPVKITHHDTHCGCGRCGR